MPTENQFSVQHLIDLVSQRELSAHHRVYGEQHGVVLELCQFFTILYLAEVDKITGNQRELEQLLSNVVSWLLEVGLVQPHQKWDDLFAVSQTEQGSRKITLRDECLTIKTTIDPLTGAEQNNKAAIVDSLTKCHVPVLVARKHLVE
jgi:hypothetical protein